LKIATTTFGCDGGLSGIGRYASTLLAHWIDAGADIQVFGHNSEYSAYIPTGKSVDWHPISELWKKPLPNILWHQLVLAGITQKADVLFLPAGNRRLPARHSIPSVGTVHDCSSLHVKGKYDRSRDLYIKRVLPWLMHQLDHIVTVSESTRTDLVQFCGIAPESITVIPLAVDHHVFFQRDEEFAVAHLHRSYGIAGPFLLYIARVEHPGKNHIQLISAFEALKRQYKIPHKLVFVGPDKERSEEVHAAASRSSVSQDIIFTGTVPSNDLSIFYSAADVFVFPSLYEGFGLPLLESMACGTPVACSDRSSLPEVGGGCAVLFDPDDPTAIASAIRKLLEESDADRAVRIRAGRMRSNQYSWQRTANRTLEVLERYGKPVHKRSLDAVTKMASDSFDRNGSL